MKSSVIFCFSAWLFISCRLGHNEHEQHGNSETVMKSEKAQPVWRVNGTEPFWGLYIHADTVIYSRLNEKTDTVFFSIHHFSDQDSIVEFHLEDAAGKEAGLLLRKGMVPCNDGMSDKEYTFEAKFSYLDETMQGCANVN